MGGAAESFARDNHPLVLRRVQIGILLGALTVLAFIPVDLVRLPESFATVTTIRIVGAGVLLATLLFIRRPAAERFAILFAGWVVFILSAVIMAVMTFAAGPLDPAYVLQVVGVIFLILGGSLLLPIDGIQMFAVGLIPLLLHAAVSARFPVEQNLPYVFASFVAVIIAAIGARASYVTRLAEYERRVLKEQLLKSHEDFVATISHDLRNPIGVIQGYASILQESGDLTSDDAQDCLRRLQSAAATALLLTNNVLYAARLESNRPRLRRERMQLVEVVDRALDGQQLFVAAKRIRLVREVDRELPPVLVDASELERVFANLLNNAVKFAPEGGEVRVRAGRAEDDMVEIGFEDGGEGIPAGCEESIFERFTDTSGRRHSTGLGLYISRSIVSAHGGRIRAENRAGGGARFVVGLPIG